MKCTTENKKDLPGGSADFAYKKEAIIFMKFLCASGVCHLHSQIGKPEGFYFKYFKEVPDERSKYHDRE